MFKVNLVLIRSGLNLELFFVSFWVTFIRPNHDKFELNEFDPFSNMSEPENAKTV